MIAHACPAGCIGFSGKRRFPAPAKREPRMEMGFKHRASAFKRSGDLT
jgi:hypothetical protein